MNVYATVEEIKNYLSGQQFEPGVESKDETLLKRFCIDASRVFDTFATNGASVRRQFFPTVATKLFDHPDDATRLHLRDDLLELTTLTTKNGSVTIASADYTLRNESGISGKTPYRTVQLHPNGTVTAFEYVNTPYDSQSVAGAWGYHDDWSGAWEDSGDAVQDNPLSDTDTIVTVTDADGNDINGFPLRFQAQQLLKIEDEYLWLISVDATGNKLTVRRGMNGTTAAQHAQDTTIYVYRPMADITHAMKLLSTYMYKRRDVVGTGDDRPIVTPQGMVLTPSTLPEEVASILVNYRKDTL